MTARPPYPASGDTGRDIMNAELYRRICILEQRVGINTGQVGTANVTNNSTTIGGASTPVNLLIIPIVPRQYSYEADVGMSSLIPWWESSDMPSADVPIAMLGAHQQVPIATLYPGPEGRPAKVAVLKVFLESDWARPDSQNPSIQSYTMFLGGKFDPTKTVDQNFAETTKYGRVGGLDGVGFKAELQGRQSPTLSRPTLEDTNFTEITTIYMGAWATFNQLGFPGGGIVKTPGLLSQRFEFVSFPPATATNVVAEDGAITVDVGPVYVPPQIPDGPGPIIP